MSGALKLNLQEEQQRVIQQLWHINLFQFDLQNAVLRTVFVQVLDG